MPNRRRRTKAQGFKEEKEITKVRILNKLKPRTTNQSDYIRTIVENDITFCTGPAGAGKTWIPCGLACEYLLNEKINKIIITRPTVEVGSSLGYIPGSALEKVHSFMIPMFNALESFLGKTELEHHLKYKNIEVIPIQYMRGLTFWKSFIIIDEAQDATAIEIKTILTRIGNNSKMVVTGDLTQSDLPISSQGALATCINKLQNIDGIGMSKLEICDIQRSEIVKRIVERLG